MKILQVITSLRTGGAERMVVELSKRMAMAGDTVEVLLFDGTHTPMCDELQAEGVRMHALGMGENAMHNPLHTFRLRRFLRQNSYDIIHTHNTPCQFQAAICGTGQSMITTEHNTSNRRRITSLFKPFDRWMYSHYRHIICVSEETRDELSRWLGREGFDTPMSVVPNGIDIERINNALPAPDLVKDGYFNVLMVSAFRPEKDQMTLIRAMKSLPNNYSLFLAGGAELPEHKALMEACRQTAADLGLGERVHFLGLRSDIPELLAASDVVVLSSRHEGMSLSILEAMASGKPLIASDVKGMREIVGGAGILFPEGDAETLAGAIWEVCENPEKAREIGERCRVRAQAYDIDETVRRYRELYGEIIRGARNDK